MKDGSCERIQGSAGMTTPANTALAALAAFVAETPREWSLPAREMAALAFCDVLAVAAAGRFSDVSGKATALLHQRAGEAEIWWSDRTADEETAAFVNGVVAHALDYDDVAPPWRGHPSAVIYPALLATLPADWSARRGAELLDAYAVAFQLAAEVGQRMLPGHYRVGWHATATIGVLAAAAAIARLQKFTSVQTAHAIGFAAIQAAGMRVSFGSDAKPAQAGFAAAAAIRACRLALAGFECALDVFEDEAGYAALHAGSAASFETLKPGNPIREPKLATALEIKLLPTCYATHRAIFAAAELVRDGPLEDIRKVEVIGSPGSHDPLRAKVPTTPVEAQFHLETLIAMVLGGLEPSLRNLENLSFTRPDIRGIAEKVVPREEADGTAKRWSIVGVEYGRGSARRRVADMPQVALSSAVWRTKLLDCLDHGRLDEESYWRNISRYIDIDRIS